MNRVKQLRENGYTVQSFPEATDVTEVRAPFPFHYFNPHFVDAPEQVLELVRDASPVESKNGEFQLLIAGNFFEETDRLPLTLLRPYEKFALQQQVQSLEQAQAEQEALLRRTADIRKSLAEMVTFYTA